jgi:hypothetical protein
VPFSPPLGEAAANRFQSMVFAVFRGTRQGETLLSGSEYIAGRLTAAFGQRSPFG